MTLELAREGVRVITGRRRRHRGGRLGILEAALLAAAAALGLGITSSCSILQSKEVAIGCQAADGATTIYAKHLGAIEENPFIPNNNVLVALKALLIWLIASQWDDMTEFGHEAIVVISCAPVANNLNVIREQRRINR